MEITFVKPSVTTHQSCEEIAMMLLRILFLLPAVLLFGIHSASATNYAVGTCLPNLVSYPTISAAVAAVPSGSVVEVCPGIYYEQVTITKPLTVEGITSANLNQAIVAVPSGGLSANAFGNAAQVLVTAGPVNITNITVDGSDNDLDGSTALVGLFYASGSSGTIKEVTTRYQLDAGKGSNRGLQLK